MTLTPSGSKHKADTGPQSVQNEHCTPVPIQQVGYLRHEVLKMDSNIRVLPYTDLRLERPLSLSLSRKENLNTGGAATRVD